MTLVYTMRTVVGIMGNVIAFGLFVSPMPTFYKIIRMKDTEQFSGVPYVATLLNCLLWTLYGLPFVTPNSILVITINGIGTVLETSYLFIFLFYASKQPRAKVLKMLAVVLTFYAAVVLAVMTATHVHKTRQLIVGILCVIVGTAMYAAPMSVMKMVIQTKSVKYMPFLLSLAAFLNGLTWTAYAFLGKIDPFIVVPNAIGTLLAVAQLVLYAIYSRKEKAAAAAGHGKADIEFAPNTRSSKTNDLKPAGMRNNNNEDGAAAGGDRADDEENAGAAAQRV